MCGIFGIALRPGGSLSAPAFRKLLEKLYVLSESRGKESAGLHLYLPTAGQAWTLKGALSATELLKSSGFQQTLQKGLDLAFANPGQGPTQPIIAVAHSRLVTNGSAELAENNQPVRWGPVTMVHNGIVVNVDELWAQNPLLRRHAEVDTEVMAAMLAQAMTQNFDPAVATGRVFAAIQGAASVAWVHGEAATLTLATNTGDLYCAMLPSGAGLVFASEQFILERAVALAQRDDVHRAAWSDSVHVAAGTGICVDLAVDGPVKSFRLSDQGQTVPGDAIGRCPMARQTDVETDYPKLFTPARRVADESLLRYNENAMREIRRCTTCVLPDTFPFIRFDAGGVCNYCRGYQPKYRGIDPATAQAEFIQSLEKYRSANGSHDVLVPFSGGRDSCYGLHLIKHEFGLNPITFTYDWGMVTDLARRNIARMCGQLGVQNLLVSADIRTKRDNIRKNVCAWLKKPDLGMVPLFMAGDKHFFRIVNELKRQTGIRLDLWAANPLENTDFKSGFCGVEPDFDKARVDYLSISRKVRLAAYYGSRFLGNTGYINSSLIDTAKAFLSYYVEPRRDFYFMFSHMVWDEREVNRTLVGTYDFELSPDSPSTWRIGDGTAPFYNYIYMTARGFSEFDTFRSNQIREGQITRQEALEAVLVENRPRTPSLRWYLETIGLDFNDTIRRVNEMDAMGLHN